MANNPEIPSKPPAEWFLFNDIAEIKDDLKSIKYILNGNGKPGLVAKVANCEEYIYMEKKSRFDTGTFVFRMVVGIVLGYISFKVGLK